MNGSDPQPTLRDRESPPLEGPPAVGNEEMILRVEEEYQRTKPRNAIEIDFQVSRNHQETVKPQTSNPDQFNKRPPPLFH